MKGNTGSTIGGNISSIKESDGSSKSILDMVRSFGGSSPSIKIFPNLGTGVSVSPHITGSSKHSMDTGYEPIALQLKTLQDELDYQADSSSSSEDSEAKTRFQDVSDKWSAMQDALDKLNKQRYVVCENIGIGELGQFYLGTAFKQMDKFDRLLSEYSSLDGDDLSISDLLTKLYNQIAVYGKDRDASEPDSESSKIAAYSTIGTIESIWKSFRESQEATGEITSDISYDSSGVVTVTKPNVIHGEIKNIFTLSASVSSSSLVGQSADLTITLKPANESHTSIESIDENDLKNIYLSSCLLNMNNVGFSETQQPVLIFWSKSLYTASFADPAPSEEGGTISSELYFNPHWFFGSDTRWASKDSGSMYIIRDVSNGTKFSGKYIIPTESYKAPPFSYEDSITMDPDTFDPNKPTALSDKITLKREVYPAVNSASGSAKFEVTGTLDRTGSESGISPLKDPSGNELSGYTIYHGTVKVSDKTKSEASSSDSTVEETVSTNAVNTVADSSSVSADVYVRIKYGSSGSIYDIVADPSSTVNKSRNDDDAIPVSFAQSFSVSGTQSTTSSSESVAAQDPDSALDIDISRIIGIRDWSSVPFYLSTSYHEAESVVYKAIADMSAIFKSKRSDMSDCLKYSKAALGMYSIATSAISNEDSGYDDSLLGDAPSDILSASSSLGNVSDISDMSISEIKDDGDIASARSSMSAARSILDYGICDLCSQMEAIDEALMNESVFYCGDSSKYMDSAYNSMKVLCEAISGELEDLKSYAYSGNSVVTMAIGDDYDYAKWSSKYIDFTDGTQLDAASAYLSFVIQKKMPSRTDDDCELVSDAMSLLGSHSVKKSMEDGGISSKLMTDAAINVMSYERSLMSRYSLSITSDPNATKIPYSIVSEIPGSDDMNSIDLHGYLKSFSSNYSESDWEEAVSDIEGIWERYIVSMNPGSIETSVPKIVASLKSAISSKVSPRGLFVLSGLCEALKKFALSAYSVGGYPKAVDSICSAFGVSEYSASSESELKSMLDASASDAGEIESGMKEYLSAWGFFYGIDEDGNIYSKDIVNGESQAFVSGSGTIKEFLS